MSHMTDPSHSSHATKAIRALQASEDEWMSLRAGEHPADRVQAHALRTQVLTQAAVVHVLLDIAESLRKISERSSTGA